MLQGIRLAPWPLPRPRDWQAYVNGVEPQGDLDFMRLRVQRRERIADPTAEVKTPANRAEKQVAVSEDD
jgi:hypothetical protein